MTHPIQLRDLYRSITTFLGTANPHELKMLEILLEDILKMVQAAGNATQILDTSESLAQSSVTLAPITFNPFVIEKITIEPPNHAINNPWGDAMPKIIPTTTEPQVATAPAGTSSAAMVAPANNPAPSPVPSILPSPIPPSLSTHSPSPIPQAPTAPPPTSGATALPALPDLHPETWQPRLDNQAVEMPCTLLPPTPPQPNTNYHLLAIIDNVEFSKYGKCGEECMQFNQTCTRCKKGGCRGTLSVWFFDGNNGEATLWGSSIAQLLSLTLGDTINLALQQADWLKHEFLRLYRGRPIELRVKYRKYQGEISASIDHAKVKTWGSLVRTWVHT